LPPVHESKIWMKTNTFCQNFGFLFFFITTNSRCLQIDSWCFFCWMPWFYVCIMYDEKNQNWFYKMKSMFSQYIKIHKQQNLSSEDSNVFLFVIEVFVERLDQILLLVCFLLSSNWSHEKVQKIHKDHLPILYNYNCKRLPFFKITNNT
jgi:hypothetical protein